MFVSGADDGQQREPAAGVLRATPDGDRQTILQRPLLRASIPWPREVRSASRGRE